MPKAIVTSIRKTAIRFMQCLDAIIHSRPMITHLRTKIRRAIIYKQNLIVPIRLFQDTLDTFVQIFLDLIYRYYKTNFHILPFNASLLFTIAFTCGARKYKTIALTKNLHFKKNLFIKLSICLSKSIQ